MKKILYIARGRPGMGHVSPLIAIAGELQKKYKQKFLSYDNGIKLLKNYDFEYRDIRGPYNSDSPYPAMDLIDLDLKVKKQIEEFQPDLVITGGELVVPALCKLIGVKCISIVTPQYVFQEKAEYKKFGKTISFLLSKSDMLLINGRFFGDKSALPNSNFVDPILRKPKLTKNEFKKNLGIPINSKVILFSTGGGDKHRVVEGEYANKLKNATSQFINSFKELRKKENNVFLLLQDVYDQQILGDGIINLGVSPNLIDFIQASDLVIGKPGLNFLHECACYAKNTVFLYFEEDWENNRNALFAEKNGFASKMSLNKIEVTSSYLKKLLENPKKSFKVSNGTNEAVTLIENFIKKC